MKRVISFVLMLMMVALSGVSAFSYSTTDYNNGDVNMNGTVDVNDCTLLQRYLVDLASLQREAVVLADTDLDGKVNIMEVTNIQKQLAEYKELSAEKKEVYGFKDTVTVRFENNRNWSKVYFYLYNSKTLEQESAWPGKQITTYEMASTGKKMYFEDIDTTKYDRIIFNDGNGQQTINIFLNKLSSCFRISTKSNNNTKELRVDPYAYTNSQTGKTDIKYLTYPSGYQKKIWIWTPMGYSAESTKKYKTIYLTDGQNLFNDNRDNHGGWQVIGSVESMIANGGEPFIIVGIDNSRDRDKELTPNIGTVNPNHSYFAGGTGETFSNFVANTVMPFVQENYHSSNKAEDNIIAGSSSGGIEAFYIGMENYDKFGGIGAISPAFLLYSKATWDSYFAKKGYDFTSVDMPKVYIFNGNNDDLEKELCVDAKIMYENLSSKNYDSSKLTLVIEDSYQHNEACWRTMFSDMMCFLIGE